MMCCMDVQRNIVLNCILLIDIIMESKKIKLLVIPFLMEQEEKQWEECYGPKNCFGSKAGLPLGRGPLEK